MADIGELGPKEGEFVSLDIKPTVLKTEYILPWIFFFLLLFWVLSRKPESFAILLPAILLWFILWILRYTSLAGQFLKFIQIYSGLVAGLAFLFGYLAVRRIRNRFFALLAGLILLFLMMLTPLLTSENDRYITMESVIPVMIIVSISICLSLYLSLYFSRRRFKLTRVMIWQSLILFVLLNLAVTSIMIYYWIIAIVYQGLLISLLRGFLASSIMFALTEIVVAPFLFLIFLSSFYRRYLHEIVRPLPTPYDMVYEQEKPENDLQKTNPSFMDNDESEGDL